MTKKVECTNEYFVRDLGKERIFSIVQRTPSGSCFSQSIDGVNTPKPRFFPSPILQLNTRFPAPGTHGAALIPRFKRPARVYTQYLNITAISIAQRVERGSGGYTKPSMQRWKERSNNCVDAGLRTISQYRSIAYLERPGTLEVNTGPSMQRGNAS